ncbi:MAG: orotidine 5'-phosphate decarboxylase / HUMPS family protein [Candidatus Micrarchaeaceae archaeon]|jgi:orotidine-5'-phosphate decarboxylase
MGQIIDMPRSVVVACDVRNIGDLRTLVRETSNVDGIGGYKIGAALTITNGLPELVNVVRGFTNLPIIYDHQKWMTDIPDTGRDVLLAVKNAGANAIIGFPLSGPVTQKRYIEEAKDVGIEIITGGEMTHKGFKTSELGYIADSALLNMYLTSADLGITNFVVPGNRTERVSYYHNILASVVGDALTFWGPGFIAQGGKINETALVAGKYFHAIVGRGIFEAADMHAAAVEYTSQLMGFMRDSE